MPTYGENNFKESKVNYINKDFDTIKNSLMNYAKSYFPNTYRDFNETSPGMMLLEMNAYVGDVLSFYIDQQYRELLLPLAEERRNIITMAKMLGYKVKPIVPSFVNLEFTSEVNAVVGDEGYIDYSDTGVWSAGIEIESNFNTDIKFTTLEPIDFTISQSNDTEFVEKTKTDTGLVETYRLTRTVKAISAEQRTAVFRVGTPEKFKRLTIKDKNVIDIISCVDSNGNNWYEVDFLAQDKVPISTHWTEDGRNNAYYNQQTGETEIAATPYSLTYITTPKRFTRETNEDDTTSLVFGNGILKDGQLPDEGYIDMEQIGIVIPGQANDLNEAVDPLLGNEYSTLGETPNNTVLTITYRIGGGIKSNVSAGEITNTPGISADAGPNTSATLLDVSNKVPARGGKDREDTIEIQEKAKAFFSTQNRCVTKEDYEARIMNMSSKYGSIAKVYVARDPEGSLTPDGWSQDQFNSDVALIQGNANSLNGLYQNLIPPYNDYIADPTVETATALVGQLAAEWSGLTTNIPELVTNTTNLAETYNTLLPSFTLSAINIYVLGYDGRKQLVGNPHTDTTESNDNLANMLVDNIQTYLSNFSILTDTYSINNGYIINFGVIFDVVAEQYADKQQVKLNCIREIQRYFKIENMQFNQPIYKSELEYILMGIEGVRSIGHVTITQKTDYFDYVEELVDSTFTYSYDEDTQSYVKSTVGSSGYGYLYDFENALNDDKTIIRPPELSTPAVFELKHPSTNVKGRVR